MPRRSPGYEAGLTYHLIARGVRGQPIFAVPDDFRHFLFVLRETLKPGQHLLLAYCLMPNHAHLLVQCGSSSLSDLMQRLLYRYARYLNRRQSRTGHVFQGRHHSRLCTDQAYYRQLLRYIHLNPVRAGLCHRAEDYPWSSFGDYLGQRGPAPVAVDRAAELLGSARGQTDGLLALLGRPLGTCPEDEWLPGWELDQEAQIRPAKAERGDPGARVVTWARPSIESLMRSVGRLHQASPEDLRSRARDPGLDRARREVARRAILEHGYRQEDVARALARGQSMVSRWLSSAEEEGPERSPG